MDDPFGPSILLFLTLLLAAVVRAAEAAVPFIDEGELKRQAEDGSARAQRAQRLIRRSERAEFGEFRMAHTLLLLAAGMAAFGWLGGALTARFAAASVRFPGLLSGVCVLAPFGLVAFMLTGVVPGHLAAHWRQGLFDRVAPACEWTDRKSVV